MGSDITKDQWDEFVSRVNAVADELFGEGGHPPMIIGSLLDVGPVITANLIPCHMLDALSDLYEQAEQLHEEFHRNAEANADEPIERGTFEDLPPEIQEVVAGMLEELGLSKDEVTFLSVVDISDLADDDAIAEVTGSDG